MKRGNTRFQKLYPLLRANVLSCFWVRIWRGCCRSAGRSQAAQLRAVLVQPFDVREPNVDTEQFVAACQLLVAALAHQPGLVDMMLFPTGLAESAASPDQAEASHGWSDLA